MQTNSVNPAGLKGFEFSPGFSSTVSSSCSRFRSSRSFLLGLPRFRFFPSGAGAFFVFFVFFGVYDTSSHKIQSDTITSSSISEKDASYSSILTPILLSNLQFDSDYEGKASRFKMSENTE